VRIVIMRQPSKCLLAKALLPVEFHAIPTSQERR
jgi:hypothetical protein